MTLVRRIDEYDARSLLALQTALDAESELMLLEPGERETVPDALAGRLAAIERGDDPSYIFVADGDEELAGYVDVSVLPFARARLTGYVVVGVRTAYGGRGIGRALLEAARDEAVRRGMRRLELTVMTHNIRALNLYLSMGFEVEGLRRDALRVGGRLWPEYYMGLLLLS